MRPTQVMMRPSPPNISSCYLVRPSYAHVILPLYCSEVFLFILREFTFQFRVFMLVRILSIHNVHAQLVLATMLLYMVVISFLFIVFKHPQIYSSQQWLVCTFWHLFVALLVGTWTENLKTGIHYCFVNAFISWKMPQNHWFRTWTWA